MIQKENSINYFFTSPISLLIVPKTVSHWIPITCNYCDDFCGGNFTNSGREDPEFNPQFVDKFCSDSNLVQDQFIGLTFLLLMAAIVLSTVANIANPGRNENTFSKFYHLLLKEKILETMEFSEVTELEAFETKLKLRWSRTYFWSILKKSAIKISLASVLALFMSINKAMLMFSPSDFDYFICDLNTYHFECLGSPGYFVEFLGKSSLKQIF